MNLVLIVVLLLLLFGALPMWPYMAGFSFGYWPSGLIALVILALVIMALARPRGTV